MMKNHAALCRKAVASGVVLILCAALAGCVAQPGAQTTHEKPGSPTAEKSFQRLLEGNQRFVAGAPLLGHQSAGWRKELRMEQHPFATILACSDSRVPVELLFDQGFGDLFVIRVAGNVVGADDLGSIEYAVHHLHTPLVFVLGHEGCGAVMAALEPEPARRLEAKGIQELLSHILPALKEIDPTLSLAERVHRCVELNVRWSMRQLQETPDLRGALDGTPPRIVGAVYELETGKVRILQ